MNEETGVTAKQRRRAQNEIEHIVAQYLGSGLKRTEFCRRHGMSLGTVNRYLKRQAACIEGRKGNGELVAVELGGGKVSGGLVAILSGGRKIEVGAGFDGPTLERLVRVLESM